MSLPNYPESDKDVITTVTHVLDEFEREFLFEMPDCQIVYDEELSYETGMKAAIAKYNYNHDNNKSSDKPTLIYNRTVLRNSTQAPSVRLNSLTSFLKLDDGNALTYVATQAEFDIQFMFVSKSIEKQEKFEVAYQSEEGISGTKELTVDMGSDLGTFKYFLTWGELTEKTIVAENNYYKAIIGSVVVRGMFFTFRAKLSVILAIKLSIYLTNKLNEPQELIGRYEYDGHEEDRPDWESVPE